MKKLYYNITWAENGKTIMTEDGTSGELGGINGHLLPDQPAG